MCVCDQNTVLFLNTPTTINVLLNWIRLHFYGFSSIGSLSNGPMSYS